MWLSFTNQMQLCTSHDQHSSSNNSNTEPRCSENGRIIIQQRWHKRGGTASGRIQTECLASKWSETTAVSCGVFCVCWNKPTFQNLESQLLLNPTVTSLTDSLLRILAQRKSFLFNVIIFLNGCGICLEIIILYCCQSDVLNDFNQIRCCSTVSPFTPVYVLTTTLFDLYFSGIILKKRLSFLTWLQRLHPPRVSLLVALTTWTFDGVSRVIWSRVSGPSQQTQNRLASEVITPYHPSAPCQETQSTHIELWKAVKHEDLGSAERWTLSEKQQPARNPVFLLQRQTGRIAARTFWFFFAPLPQDNIL